MLRLMVWVCLIFICKAQFTQDGETIDLLTTDPYTWNGIGLGNTQITVKADDHTIKVTVDDCNIGNNNARPNEEYLTLKNGEKGSTSEKNGLIFAYITKPKKLYFYSSSVVLQMKADNPLNNPCRVIFEKGDVQESTLPPITTTEMFPTPAPGVSIYSTVLISGRSINDFNQNKSFALQLKSMIADMANEYTTLEGFCLVDEDVIQPQNVLIDTLEQCPAKWPDFQQCVRLVYSLPIQINDSCSLWTGYQLTAEHLDIMWSRLANKYLKNGFAIYTQNDINTVISWWKIGIIALTLIFVAAMTIINVNWKKKENLKRVHYDDDFLPEMRKTSDVSLTPPYFQSIPPMFDKTSEYERAQHTEEIHGADNKGFQYDEIPDCEEDATVL